MPPRNWPSGKHSAWTQPNKNIITKLCCNVIFSVCCIFCKYQFKPLLKFLCVHQLKIKCTFNSIFTNQPQVINIVATRTHQDNLFSLAAAPSLVLVDNNDVKVPSSNVQYSNVHNCNVGYKVQHGFAPRPEYWGAKHTYKHYL